MDFGYTILAMKNLLVGVLLGALLIFFTLSGSAYALTNPSGMLIVEVQTGSSTSASEEFIELYNQSDTAINLANYRIEYTSASSTNFATPSRVISLSGTLSSHGRYLIASSGYLTQQANTSFAATLAKTGGQIRLVSTENSLIIHDLVGWGSASIPETQATPAPNGGESLQRKVQTDGSYQDTDNNNQDFIVASPTPESSGLVVPNPDDDQSSSDPSPAPDPSNTDSSSDPIPQPDVPAEPELPILITELLPNPGSPGTDANDEFVELYNPNTQAVNLQNYQLETGNDFSYHFTLGAIMLAPDQYVALYSKDTNLVLSNSAGKARILDSNGSVLSETDVYDTAKDNMAWILIGANWQWSTTPTPGQANILTSDVTASAVTAKKTSTAKPKTSATKSTTKAKVAAAKTTKPKASSTKPKNTASDQPPADKKLGVAGPIHPAILAGVGAIAVGYAGYEYRTDIASKFQRLRRNGKNRPKIGPPA